METIFTKFPQCDFKPILIDKLEKKKRNIPSRTKTWTKYTNNHHTNRIKTLKMVLNGK